MCLCGLHWQAVPTDYLVTIGGGGWSHIEKEPEHIMSSNEAKYSLITTKSAPSRWKDGLQNVVSKSTRNHSVSLRATLNFD